MLVTISNKKRSPSRGPSISTLFNVVAYMLAILIERAKVNSGGGGGVPDLVDEGLSILQYADDTIPFMENNIEHAKNLQLVSSVLELAFIKVIVVL